MLCNICQYGMEPAFCATVLGKHDVQFHYCANCGYLCTEHPFWLDEAYSDAIVASDTGIAARNLDASKRLASLLYFGLGERGRGKWLDYAGGYGILTRLMRDYGFDFYWSDKYCPNLIARGFELPADEPCVGVTALEAIEHSENPREFVARAVGNTGASYFIFTTETFEGAPPSPGSWWYYGLEMGQHISFFQPRTLATLAEALGYRYIRAHKFHIFSRVPLNECLLRAVSGRPASVLHLVVRKRLQSKVETDHVNLVSVRSGRMDQIS